MTGSHGVGDGPSAGGSGRDATSPFDDPEFVAGLRAVPSRIGDTVATWPALDIRGSAPDGSTLCLVLDGVAGPVLLVFLATRCDGCDLFWQGLADGSDPSLAGVTICVIAKGSDGVALGELAAMTARIAPIPVVLSDRAWADYRVTGYPFLVLVEPSTRRILAETVAYGWTDVAATVEAGLGR